MQLKEYFWNFDTGKYMLHVEKTFLRVTCI